MEGFPLNDAHKEERVAAEYKRNRKLEAAIHSHEKAIDYLKEALVLTKNSVIQQSIELQISQNKRQQQILRSFIQQVEKQIAERNAVKAMDNQRSRMKSGNLGGAYSKRVQNITVEMNKNTEKMDSLFSMLIIPDDKSASESCEVPSSGLKESNVSLEKDNSSATTSSNSEENIPDSSIDITSGIKKEKDSSTVVEELQTLRDHQAELIAQLLTELQQMEKENSSLKNQVRELQTKCEQYESEKRRMRALADSSCSPFVFSPLSEFSPDPPSFPDLAPLEMPPLDFMENFANES